MICDFCSIIDTSDGKNLPPDVQTNQQKHEILIREQKPEIHHLVNVTNSW